MNNYSWPKRVFAAIKTHVAQMDLGYLAVAFICLLAIWPFISRSSLPQNTDTELHIFRLAEMSRLVRGGELFPRWAPNFYFGYGYPIFNFYAPLTYQLGLAVDFLPILGPVQAVKVLFIAGIALSGLGMYGLVRDLWGRGAGLVAAASYVYAPFILFVDPYARGDLPESFSFGVFAVSLWALNRLRGSPTWLNWMIAIFSVAALILTHNLMSMVFFAILVGWAIWQVAIKANGRVSPSIAGVFRRIISIRIFLALFLALGLAAYFWLPVALESDTVNLGSLIGEGGHFDYKNHFLAISELFGGPERIDWGATEPGYTLSLGIAQSVLGFGGVLALFSSRTRFRKQGLFFLSAFIVLLFLMLKQSSPIWQITPLLPFLQFPWRLLGPAAAMLAVLGGIGTSLLLQIIPSRISGWASAGIVALILISVLPLIHVPPWPDDFGDTSAQRVLQIELSGRWLGTTSTADFVPATVEVLPKPEPGLIAGFYSQEPLDRVNRATLPSGTVILSESLTPLRTKYTISSELNFPLRLFQFDFPGWEATVDGVKVETDIGRPDGFLVVPIPAGEHTVEVSFNNTWERRVALVISAIALITTIVISWQYAKYRHDELIINVEKPGETSSDAMSVWPVIGLTLALLVAYVVVIEPSAALRYDSTDFIAQPAQRDTFANFGDQIALIGYDLDSDTFRPGEQIDLTLYWKAMNQLEINYQVFVHFMDEDGNLVAQSDKLNPSDFPTRRWPISQYVRDTHSLTIPEELANGDYYLASGLWVAADGWRLPLLDGSGDQIGDTFQLPLKITVLGE
ncbi:MAG TPA: hypothetical protein VFI27_14315 [candidate division Zixibacteria bacterium]|nr:hypothetical protein [candidate division Zixibacteria bacterium]